MHGMMCYLWNWDGNKKWALVILFCYLWASSLIISIYCIRLLIPEWMHNWGKEVINNCSSMTSLLSFCCNVCLFIWAGKRLLFQLLLWQTSMKYISSEICSCRKGRFLVMLFLVVDWNRHKKAQALECDTQKIITIGDVPFKINLKMLSSSKGKYVGKMDFQISKPAY